MTWGLVFLYLPILFLPFSRSFAPSSKFALSTQKCHSKHQQPRLSTSAAMSKKSPLDRLGNFFESTAASVMDAIFMLPQREVPPGFRKVRTQFIAALGDPQASSGQKADQWGIWVVDPGPRGVYLTNYESELEERNFQAPAGWTFDKTDFWIEEYGRIMEPPVFPLPAGRYWVTGGREASCILTVDENAAWKLEQGTVTRGGVVMEGVQTTLYDVTHLPCRSARYTPPQGKQVGGTPKDANVADFPVKPGAEMPPIGGCDKVDYAVLFVIGVEN